MNLKVEGLSFSYSSVPVLKDVNFEIERGECVAILGTNGTGKSTLLKCLNRILKYKTGTVYVSDKDVKKLAGIELAKEMGYVPQQLLFADTTVFDAVLMGRRPYIRWEASENDLKIVDDLMARMNISDFALRSVTALSGGEAQKVAIARALAQQPQVLLFDEPTSNLDIRNQMEVVELIKAVARENNLSVIVTMHDLNLAVRFADKFIMMKDGTVYATGDLGIVTPENIKAVYGLDVHVANVEDQLVIVPV